MWFDCKKGIQRPDLCFIQAVKLPEKPHVPERPGRQFGGLAPARSCDFRCGGSIFSCCFNKSARPGNIAARWCGCFVAQGWGQTLCGVKCHLFLDWAKMRRKLEAGRVHELVLNYEMLWNVYIQLYTHRLWVFVTSMFLPNQQTRLWRG